MNISQIVEPELVVTKLCSKCRQERSLVDYCWQNRQRDRRVSECRECSTARRRVWQAKRSERMTEGDLQLLREIQNRARFWSGKRLLTEIIQAFGSPDAAATKIVRVFDHSESIGDHRALLVLCRLLLEICRACEAAVDLDVIKLARRRVPASESR